MKVIEIATPDGKGYYMPLEPIEGQRHYCPNFPDAVAVRLIEVTLEEYMAQECIPGVAALMQQGRFT